MTGKIGEVYNVGSSAEISNLDLCRLLLDKFKLPASTDDELKDMIVFVEDRPFNDHRYAVDGSKLKKLGWVQNTPFSVGLSTTVDWYRTYGDTWWGNIDSALTPHPVMFLTNSGTSALRSDS